MIYTVSDFVCVQYDWGRGLLRHRWNGVERFAGLSLFQSVHESLLELFRQHQATNWLVELTAAPLTVEDQLWLEQTWIPSLATTTVRRLAVVSDDAYNLMTLEGLLPLGQKGLQRMLQFFADPVSALEWLTGSEEAAEELQHEWEENVEPGLLTA